MLLKKSDQLPSPVGRPWLHTLLQNVWVLAALAAMVFFARWLENPDHFNAYYFQIVMMVGITITLAVSLQLINGVSGQFSLGHAGFMALGAYLSAYATKTYGGQPIAQGNGDYFSDPGGVMGYFLALAIALVVAAGPMLLIFLAVRQLRRLSSALPAVGMLLLLAWIAMDVVVASKHQPVPYYCVWTHGWKGCIDLFNALLRQIPNLSTVFGHLSLSARQPLSFAIALLGGGLVAAGSGLIIGIPTLRLRGDYLAIATLGFGQIVQVLIINSEPLGGAVGLTAIATYQSIDEDNLPQRCISPWIFGTALIAFLLIWRLVHSSQGRAMKAVRQDEIAATAVGINTTASKVLAFVVGAFFAGVAGGLYAHLNGALSPDTFSFIYSVELVVIVTLGGLGNLWGALIAAVLVTLLPEVLNNADRLPHMTSQSAIRFAHGLAANRRVVYALVLIAVMIIRARWRDWVHGRWRWTG